MKETTLADLKPDPKNARKHNARNIGMIEKSLREVGAARSGVIDVGNSDFRAKLAMAKRIKWLKPDAREYQRG